MSKADTRIVLGKLPRHRLGMRRRPVLWGWKRNAASMSRVIYLSGRIEAFGEEIVLCDAYLFYRHRAPRVEIEILRERAEHGDAATLRALGFRYEIESHGRLAVLTVQIGNPRSSDYALVARLRRRRAHKVMPRGLIEEHPDFDLSDYGPFDLYAGSGLSYEAGIPTLSTAHEAFGVDDPSRGEFLFGRDDLIPEVLAADPAAALRRMVEVDVACINARPSKSHWIIADLHDRGWIGKVLTDNVDDLFEQCGIPYVGTRGTGIFNDPVEPEFSSTARALLAVGVSADRRSVIRHARNRGLKIVVINPHLPVSPCSRNLDYLRQGDIFLRRKASEALPLVIARLPRQPLTAVPLRP